MTDRSDPAPESRRLIAPQAWLMITLCGCAGMLFFLDRQTLSVLKTTLKTERGWTDTDYGGLVSVFMFCYTGCYLFTGRWIDRWGTRFSMPFFLGLMSAAMMLSGASRSWGEMAVGRGLLGFAEAGVMPSILVAIFAWFPPERRGMATTITEPIYVVGQILATPLAALATKVWHWHVAFYVPGVLGLGIAAAWWCADQPRRKAPAVLQPPPALPLQPTYRETLRRPEIWGVIIARLISDPVWFFLLYWEAGYLQEKLGMNLTLLAKVGWIPTAAATLTLIFSGMACDRIVRRFGWTPARTRRWFLQSAAVMSPLLALIPWVSHAAGVIVLLCLVRIMCVIWLNFTNVFMGELVPRSVLGSAIALMSAFGAATGLLCNALIGPIVTQVGYTVIFSLGALLHPLAALVLWRFYGRNQRVTAES